jgi:hypothetical protein
MKMNCRAKESVGIEGIWVGIKIQCNCLSILLTIWA